MLGGVARGRDGEGTEMLTGSHDNRRNDHQFAVVPAEDAQQPQYDHGTGEDGKSDGDGSDANACRIMAIYIESLRRPEHDDGEKVGTANGGDDEREDKDSGFLLQPSWEHGMLGTVCLP